jgi:hypothetical protein
MGWDRPSRREPYDASEKRVSHHWRKGVGRCQRSVGRGILQERCQNTPLVRLRIPISGCKSFTWTTNAVSILTRLRDEDVILLFFGKVRSWLHDARQVEQAAVVVLSSLLWRKRPLCRRTKRKPALGRFPGGRAVEGPCDFHQWRHSAPTTAAQNGLRNLRRVLEGVLERVSPRDSTSAQRPR